MVVYVVGSPATQQPCPAFRLAAVVPLLCPMTSTRRGGGARPPTHSGHRLLLLQRQLGGVQQGVFDNAFQNCF